MKKHMACKEDTRCWLLGGWNFRNGGQRKPHWEGSDLLVESWRKWGSQVATKLSPDFGHFPYTPPDLLHPSPPSFVPWEVDLYRLHQQVPLPSGFGLALNNKRQLQGDQKGKKSMIFHQLSLCRFTMGWLHPSTKDHSSCQVVLSIWQGP